MKKMKTKTKKIKKFTRRNINKEEVIEQITRVLHCTANPKVLFDISNMVLGTRFSTKEHRLISRL